MTVNEKIRQLIESFKQDLTPEQRHENLIQLLTYTEIFWGVENKDINDSLVNERYNINRYNFVKYDILEKLSNEMTNEEAFKLADDPVALRNMRRKVLDDIEKFEKETRAAHEKKFKETHPEPLTLQEFTEKAKENGWVLTNDGNDNGIINSVYRAAWVSGSEKHIALYDKMLNTQVKTVEARKAFFQELLDAEPELHKDPLNSMENYDIYGKKLENKIRENNSVSQKNIDRKIEAYQQKKQQEIEKAGLKQILKDNGWKKPEEVSDHFYMILKQSGKVKDPAKLEEMYNKLKTAKIDEKKPYTVQNALIRETLKTYDAQKTNLSYAGDAYKKLNRAINGNAEYIENREEREKEEKRRQEERARKQKLRGEFDLRLTENGWPKETVKYCGYKLFDMCHYDGANNKQELEAMFHKLSTTKIGKALPLKDIKPLIDETVRIYAKGIGCDLTKEESYFEPENVHVIRNIQNIITDKDLEKEAKDYYAFNKLSENEKKKAEVKKNDDNERRRKAPTFDSLVKADDLARQKQKEADKLARQQAAEAAATEARWKAQNLANEQEQAELKARRENKAIFADLQNTTGLVSTDFFNTKRKFHTDTPEFIAMRDSMAVLNFYVSKDKNDLKNSEDFKKALLETYKASNQYRVKKLEQAKKPLDSDWHPTSPMGEARWNGALALEALAIKYIPEMVNKYHEEAEKVAYNKGFVKDRKIEDKVMEKYSSELNALDRSAERVRRMSLAESADDAKGQDKENIKHQIAKLIAIKSVDRMYQANAEAGIQEEFDNAQFVSDVDETTNNIENRADFKRMMQNNTAEQLITAAKQGGGKGLMIKLSDAQKDLIEHPPAAEQQVEVKKNLNNNAKIGM